MELTLDAVAKRNYGGDILQALAEIAAGKLAATVLYEPPMLDLSASSFEPGVTQYPIGFSGWAAFTDDLDETTARQFMSRRIVEVRRWVRYPVRQTGANSAFITNGGEEVMCRLVRETVTVTLTIPDEITAPAVPDTKRWPWGEYETKLLAKLALAAEHFWAGYDDSKPATAHKNEVVSNWLQTEHDVTPRVAIVMAQILRADGVPPGPRASNKKN